MSMWSSNDKKTYQRAFTVQELLVAMVISSLIMGMMYAIYVQLNKQLYAYSDYGQEQMRYNQFKQVLASDLFFAHTIERQGIHGLRVSFRKRDYEYLFLGDMVVRDRPDVTKDTFHIRITGFDLEENEGYKAIRLHTIMGGEPMTIFEAKETSLADQINKFYGNGH